MFFFALTAFGQEKVNCEKYTVDAYDGGTHNYLPFLNCPDFDYVINDVELHTIPNSVKEQNDNYLRRRLGDEFFENDITLEGVQMVSRDSVEVTRKNMGGSWCDGKIKFAFLYSFEIKNHLYNFCTVYNDDGKRVSKNQVPNFRNDNTVYDFMKICDIIEIAAKDKTNKGKKILDMSPKFDQAYNSMLWIVKKPSVSRDPEYTYYRIMMIDAVTGEIVFRKKIRELRAAKF